MRDRGVEGVSSCIEWFTSLTRRRQVRTLGLLRRGRPATGTPALDNPEQPWPARCSGAGSPPRDLPATGPAVIRTNGGARQEFIQVPIWRRNGATRRRG